MIEQVYSEYKVPIPREYLCKPTNLTRKIVSAFSF